MRLVRRGAGGTSAPAVPPLRPICCIMTISLEILQLSTTWTPVSTPRGYSSLATGPGCAVADHLFLEPNYVEVIAGEVPALRSA